MAKEEVKTTIVANVNNSEVNNSEVKNSEVANSEVKSENVEAQKDQSKKVSAKVAIKSIGKVAKLIRSERIGVNATIRLLLESVESGDNDAINVLCALCDVPTDMVHSITVENIRRAVNDYYPYVGVYGDRKINVKIKSVYYTTAQDNKGKEIQDARAFVKTGYYAVEASDYLMILITAAKARAKGTKQKVVASENVYKDRPLILTDSDITVSEILKAKRGYNADGCTIWHKHNLFGYYV